MLPGRDVVGDGWVLEFPGLVIEPTVTAQGEGRLQVAAKVGLMCGCPIEPGGPWNLANYTVQASLLAKGKVVSQTPLTYAGTPSQFSSALPKTAPGAYVLRITAADAKTPNAGVLEQKVVVR